MTDITHLRDCWRRRDEAIVDRGSPHPRWDGMRFGMATTVVLFSVCLTGFGQSRVAVSPLGPFLRNRLPFTKIYPPNTDSDVRFRLQGTNPFGCEERLPLAQIPHIGDRIRELLVSSGGHVAHWTASHRHHGSHSAPVAYSVWFDVDSSLSDGDLPLLMELDNIMRLSLRHTKVTATSIPLLRLLAGEVENLDVSGLGFTYKQVEELSQAFRNHTVYSEYGFTSHGALGALLPDLLRSGLARDITLVRGESETTLAALARLPKLESLTLYMGKHAVSPFPPRLVFSSLRELKLVLPRELRSEDLLVIRQQPHLRVLRLCFVGRGEGLEGDLGPALGRLEHLELNGAVGNDDLGALCESESLRFLYLADRSSALDCTPFQRLPQLRALGLESRHLINAGALGRCEKLRHLLLQGSPQHVIDLGFLKQLKNLRTLTLTGFQIDNQALLQIAACRQLRGLSYGPSSVASNLECLGQLEQLAVLRLPAECRLGVLAPKLARLAPLRTLDLSAVVNLREDDPLVRRLRYALPGCSVLLAPY